MVRRTGRNPGNSLWRLLALTWPMKAVDEELKSPDKDSINKDADPRKQKRVIL